MVTIYQMGPYTFLYGPRSSAMYLDTPDGMILWGDPSLFAEYRGGRRGLADMGVRERLSLGKAP